MTHERHRSTCRGGPARVERAARSARLLVIGSADLRWFADVVPHGVAARLARHAESPVLVVPERAARSWRGVDVVVCPNADGTLDEEVWGFAFDQARTREARFRVVQPRRLRAAATAAQMAPWRTKFPSVRTSDDRERGGAACGLVLVQRSRDRPGPLGDQHQGALALAELYQCSVAVVPAD